LSRYGVDVSWQSTEAPAADRETRAMTLPNYEIYAIRYAERDAKRAEHFIGGDPHDAPMPMDYFTWIIRGGGRVIAVDTGFTAEVAKKRGRRHLRCPVETMARLDIAPDGVSDVVITHMHYDHAGNFHKFPRGRFHLQEKEMQFVTGRHMRYPVFGHSFEVDEVVGMVRLNFAGQVEFHNGEAEIAPGVSVHHVGGHTAGLQIVRVHTQRGWVVLASDSSHYFEHIRTNRLFTVAYNLGDMIDAFRTVERLADSPDHIIPGHDPLVTKMYPAVSPALEGVILRLDVDPKKPG
jgi:glyoxylase-like metal-dependent hydrolase (beta-lactamase superfamily II)